MRIFGENLSVSWENPVPLAKEPHLKPWEEGLLTSAHIEELPLETFPIIDDFEVVLLPTPPLYRSWTYGRKDWGYHLGFFSQQRGLLAYFGLEGGVAIDYSRDDFGIPFDFWDLEQGWEQVIFERGNYIYVLEGDIDDDTSGYHCWFRVRKERYLAEWQLALEACRRIISQVEGK